MLQLKASLLAWIGSFAGKPPAWERVVRSLLPPERCGHLREHCLVREGSLFLVQPFSIERNNCWPIEADWPDCANILAVPEARRREHEG